MVMGRKLYGNSIDPTCEICLHGKRSADGKAVLCIHKGVMPLYHFCRKFIYDPLKREPRLAKKLPTYSPEDFSLD